MYILFEKIKSDGGDDINNWDCMGIRVEEKEAIEWVQKNPDYRTYKYCSIAPLQVNHSIWE